MLNISNSSKYQPQKPSLMPPSFKGAIFDFDGTLVDSHDIWAEVDRRFLEQRGLPYTDEIAREIPALGFKHGAAYVIDKFGLHESVEQICDEWNAMGQELYATQVTFRRGALEYVSSLASQGIPCALATTNDPHVIGALKHRMPIDELFDVQVYGCQVERSKHFPDIYEAAAEKLCVDTRNCMVFEDLPAGLKACKTVGFQTCGLHAHNDLQDLDQLKSFSDVFIHHWTDIPQINS